MLSLPINIGIVQTDVEIPDSIVKFNKNSENPFSDDTLRNIMQLVTEKGAEIVLTDLSGIEKKFINTLHTVMQLFQKEGIETVLTDFYNIDKKFINTLRTIMPPFQEEGIKIVLTDLCNIEQNKFIDRDSAGSTLLHKLVSSNALEFDKDSYILAVKILLAILTGEKLSISEGDTTISAINIKNHKGRTALHELVLSPQIKGWSKDPLTVDYIYEFFEILRNSGAEINTKDNDGWTPLEHAAKLTVQLFHSAPESYDAVFEILLELGANPDFAAPASASSSAPPAVYRQTNLHNFIMYSAALEMIELSPEPESKKTENIGFILKAVAKLDINAQNEKGETALHLAAKRGLLIVVQILFALEANPYLKDSNNKGPEDYVLEKISKLNELSIQQRSSFEEIENVLKNNKPKNILQEKIGELKELSIQQKTMEIKQLENTEEDLKNSQPNNKDNVLKAISELKEVYTNWMSQDINHFKNIENGIEKNDKMDNVLKNIKTLKEAYAKRIQMEIRRFKEINNTLELHKDSYKKAMLGNLLSTKQNPNPNNTSKLV